jgi:hypothetical protein
MRAGVIAVALSLCAAVVAPPAAAQAVPAEETRAHFGGHSTTVELPYRTFGPIRLTLALLADGTGWLYGEPLPGSTYTRRQRQIYRWWVAQDGRLCIHYSPAPDRLFDRSFWSCWRVVRGADGKPALASPQGEAFPVLHRVSGNALAGMNRFFTEAVQRHFPGGPPTPQPPLNPPPP